MAELWERQPGESPQAWAARQHYINAGPERSQSKTAEALGKDLRQLKRWASKWAWRKSSEAFDAYRDQLAATVAEAVHVEAAETAAVKLSRRFDELQEELWETFRLAGEFLRLRIKETSEEGAKRISRRELADRTELVLKTSKAAERSLALLSAHVSYSVETAREPRIKVVRTDEKRPLIPENKIGIDIPKYDDRYWNADGTPKHRKAEA